ncbi:MAG TPA: hypothetical protein VGK74_20610 [Symbiobacteriaceae bacterium]
MSTTLTWMNDPNFDKVVVEVTPWGKSLTVLTRKTYEAWVWPVGPNGKRLFPMSEWPNRVDLYGEPSQSAPAFDEAEAVAAVRKWTEKRLGTRLMALNKESTGYSLRVQAAGLSPAERIREVGLLSAVAALTDTRFATLTMSTRAPPKPAPSICAGQT